MKKICPHIEGGVNVAIGSPPVIKLVNVSAAYVREVRATAGPSPLIVVRWIDRAQPLASPREDAARWYGAHADEMIAMTNGRRDGAVAFEGYNEVPDQQAAAYAAFEIARLEALHQAGVRAVVGNWSVGTPDIPVWGTYAPLLAAMRPTDLVGLHEYWVDGADVGNVWHCGRWQLVPELAGRPIVITECGRDRVEGRGAAGWRRTCGPQTFLNDLRQYDALLARYPNVVGACVYTMGQYASEWAPFDVASIWPQVVAEQEAGVQNVQPSATIHTPIDGARVSQRFGEHPEWYPGYAGHPGIDLAVPAGGSWREWHGTPVRATISGRCLTVDDTSGYGLYCYIAGDSADELLAHLSGFAIANGAQVTAGDVVGYVGYTGNCKPTGGAGTHLHWGVRPNNPYNRQNRFKGYVDPLGASR